MKLLLKAWTSDEYTEPRAEYAVVDMTPQHAQRLLGYIAQAATLRAQDWQFCDIEYWDCLDWREYNEEIEGLVGDAGMVPDISEEHGDYVNTESDTVIVTQHDVRWRCVIEHADSVAYTASITREELEKFAKA